ncbi:MAG: GNAT family N-acetyltransferase [Alicyclobacillus macrosporangiidus]|uniref:GNAT family N-acetyltransferase n=1 Tax=Alicyclobacillus macrosporangiidus TaxID=392015 RepID=UPI0034E950BE|nr:GNAT family N-acetyltransferase [Alicyclobacillus macrosporangiidus]
MPDLAVDKEFQRAGIGKELVPLVREKLGEGITLILVSAPTAVEYYPRLGFKKIDKAFWIRRKR